MGYQDKGGPKLCSIVNGYTKAFIKRKSDPAIFDPANWRKLDDNVKTFVKDYNVTVSYNEDTSKNKVPSKVIVTKARKIRNKTPNESKEQKISTINVIKKG